MLLDLIQILLGHKSQFCCQILAKEWNHLYNESIRQTVAGICFEGVQKLPKEQCPPQKLLFQWLALTEQIKHQNNSVNMVLTELAQLLNEQQIKYAVVKGQIVGSYYPNPCLRQAGDIDFLVDEDDFERTKQLLEKEWHIAFHETEGHHHIEFEYKGIPLEQHRKLIKLYDKRKEDYWDALVKQSYDKQLINGVEVATLSPTIHSIYIFLHLYHHLLELGVGLRQFVDWTMILHTCQQKIEHEAIKQHLKVLGMERAYRACGAILVDKLGLPAEEFTYQLNDSDRKYAERILNVVEYRGNMGHYNLKGGSHGMWHNIEATCIKVAHFMKFMPLAPAFSCGWLTAELKRKISRKLK